MNLTTKTGARAGQPDFASFDLADWLVWFDAQADQQHKERLIYDERLLSGAEAKVLGRSIAQFQLGEVSDGAYLVKAMTSWAMRNGQDDLVTLAHKLVREARHHAFLLAEFMKHHDLPQARAHPLDAGFRIIRRLGRVETMLSTLMVAELIATHYYQCLGHSTRSTMLKRISAELLEDEKAHIYLYRRLLADLRGERGRFHNLVIKGIEHCVFLTALVAVWPFHHKVYRRAGTGLSTYWHVYWARFRETIKDPQSDQEGRLEAVFAQAKEVDLI